MYWVGGEPGAPDASPADGSADLHADKSALSFVPLEGESASGCDARAQAFAESWHATRRLVEDSVGNDSAQLCQAVAEFVAASHPASPLPTAIVEPGAQQSGAGAVLSAIAAAASANPEHCVVQLSLKQCHTLADALQVVVALVVGEGLVVASGVDLDVVSEWCSEHALDRLRVAIVVTDADQFNRSVLFGLVRLFDRYSAAVPFRLIWGVLSLTDMFAATIPPLVARLIQGVLFTGELLHKPVDTAAARVLLPQTPALPLVFLPLFVRLLREHQRLVGMLMDQFTLAVHYSYMAHFYSQPAPGVGGIEAASAEALRRVPSFRHHVDQLVKAGHREQAQLLLELDHAVVELANEAARAHATQTHHMALALELLESLGDTASNKLDLYTTIGTHEEYALAVAKATATLAGSSAGRSLALAARWSKGPPELAELAATSPATWELAVEALLLFGNTFPFEPPHLFKERVMFERWDLVEAVLAPAVRPTIENGLADARKYLLPGQENGAHRDAFPTLSAVADPLLCEMFRLYREANVAINLHDYFLAFAQVWPAERLVPLMLEMLETPEAELVFGGGADLEEVYRALAEELAEELWQRVTLAWFLQCIAEMTFMGVVKDGKRRNDTVEKLVWKGL